MAILDFFSESPHMLFDESWQAFFNDESQAPYFKNLVSFLKQEEGKGVAVYPPKSLIFNSFFQVPLDKIKVVIMGQDPYHGCGQAHGLSFSVAQGVAAPPSLKNIFKEIQADLHIEPPKHGCLLSWAHQGVLLLNATLTVRASSPKSHYGQGWEIFTDKVIQKIVSQNKPTVFMLWGKSAQEKCLHFLNDSNKANYLVLQTTHPSPFSAHYGFLGSRHFSQANSFLEKHGLAPVDWSVS